MQASPAPSELSPSKESPLFNSEDAVRIISRLTVGLVVLLAIGSFILSFEALWQFAASSGAIAEGRAWIFPLVVDGSIIVFSVSALRCSIAREDGRWPMSLVITSTAFSMVFNVAHAPGGFLPGLVGVMPPLLLFLSFESLMRQIKSGLSAGEGRHGARKLPSSPSSTLVAKSSHRPAASKATSSENTDQARRRQAALRLLSAGSSKRAVAKKLGMSLRTIRKLTVVEQAA